MTIRWFSENRAQTYLGKCQDVVVLGYHGGQVPQWLTKYAAEKDIPLAEYSTQNHDLWRLIVLVFCAKDCLGYDGWRKAFTDLEDALLSKAVAQQHQPERYLGTMKSLPDTVRSIFEEVD